MRSRLPPARTCSEAVLTITASSRPRGATSRCRLRPGDSLARVVAVGGTTLRGLHRLGMQHRRRGLRISALGAEDPVTQRVVHLIPGAIGAPGVESAVGGVPGCQIVRLQPPGAAADQYVRERAPADGRISAAGRRHADHAPESAGPPTTTRRRSAKTSRPACRYTCACHRDHHRPRSHLWSPRPDQPRATYANTDDPGSGTRRLIRRRGGRHASGCRAPGAMPWPRARRCAR